MTKEQLYNMNSQNYYFGLFVMFLKNNKTNIFKKAINYYQTYLLTFYVC